MSLPRSVYIIDCIFRRRFYGKSTGDLHWREIGVVCMALMALSSISAYGQTINGSVYSYFGIGNLQGRSSAYNRALSYTGVAVRDDFNINGMNPAAYNSLVKPFTTFFEIGANYESTLHETTASSSTSKTGGLNGINFLVKASSKLGIMVVASPLSSISCSTS